MNVLSGCAVKKGLSFFVPSSDNEKELVNDARFIDAIALKNAGDFEKSISILLDILKSKGNHAPIYFELSKMYAQKNESEKALKYINSAVDLNSKNKWFLNYKISLTKQLGLYEECEKSYLLRQKIYPNNTDYDIEFSDFYITFKKYFKALKLYEKIEQKIGVSHDINFNKFLIYKGLGEYEKSEKEIKQLIKIFPAKMTYYIQYADFKMDHGQEYDALQIYKQALTIKPQDPYILNEQARYYMRIHKHEQAFERYKIIISDPSFKVAEKKQILRKFVHLSDSDPQFYPLASELTESAASIHPYDFSINMFAADFMFEAGNYKSSIDYYLRTIDLNPNNYNAWIQLVIAYQSIGDYRAMSVKIDEAIELFPIQPLFYFYGGMAHIQMDEVEKSIEMLEEGNDLVVETDQKLKAQFLSSLGDAYHANQQHEKSDEYFELSLELDPDNFYVLNNYAYYLSERNQKLEKAKLMSEKSNRLHPDEASFQDTYGWILFQLGDYENALLWLRLAEKNGGSQSRVINEHIGDVLHKTGDIDAAKTYWLKAKELGEDSEKLKEKLKM